MAETDTTPVADPRENPPIAIYSNLQKKKKIHRFYSENGDND